MIDYFFLLFMEVLRVLCPMCDVRYALCFPFFLSASLVPIQAVVAYALLQSEILDNLFVADNKSINSVFLWSSSCLIPSCPSTFPLIYFFHNVMVSRCSPYPIVRYSRCMVAPLPQLFSSSLPLFFPFTHLSPLTPRAIKSQAPLGLDT